MVQMVLGTDMASHFGDQLAFKESVVEAGRKNNGPGGPSAAPVPVTVSTKVKILRMALHISDISNPTKAREISNAWTVRLMGEFFAQGDRERAAGLPISPMCDREATSVPRSQVGFMDVIVRPSFELWFEAPAMTAANPAMRTEVLTQLEENKQYWVEQGRIEKEAAAAANAAGGGGGGLLPRNAGSPQSAVASPAAAAVAVRKPRLVRMGSHASPLPSLAEDDDDLEEIANKARHSISVSGEAADVAAEGALKPLPVLGTPKPAGGAAAGE